MVIISESRMMKDIYRYLCNIHVHGKETQRHPETNGYETWVLMSTPLFLPSRSENGSPSNNISHQDPDRERVMGDLPRT